MIPLRQIAFARSGDKGDSANIAVFGRTSAGYAWLREHLTAARVEAWFRPLGVGPVTRYDVPNLEALNFVLPHVLGGGGSRSLRIDAQGKTLGMALLEMPVEVDFGETLNAQLSTLNAQVSPSGSASPSAPNIER